MICHHHIKPVSFVLFDGKPSFVHLFSNQPLVKWTVKWRETLQLHYCTVDGLEGKELV